MNDKITEAHRDRSAYIYIRQSTLQQVQHNVESNRRQYALRERARALGFNSVVVVDDDLGISGAGTQQRPGFSRLLAAVCNGEVGAVFALEAQRNQAPRLRRWFFRWMSPPGSLLRCNLTCSFAMSLAEVPGGSDLMNRRQRGFESPRRHLLPRQFRS